MIEESVIYDYLWLAKRRPHNRIMNRILLLNAKGKRKALTAVTVTA